MQNNIDNDTKTHFFSNAVETMKNGCFHYVSGSIRNTAQMFSRNDKAVKTD